MFFKPKVAQQDSKDSEKSSTSKDGNTCTIEENLPKKFQSTVHLVINNAEKKNKSEIMRTPKCITSGYSNNSCSDMNKLF